MKKLIGTILTILTLGVLLAGAAHAAPAQRCVSATLGNTATDSPVIQVRPDSAPWTIWVGTLHGVNTAQVQVVGFGPCLDSRSATTCSRGPGVVLGNLSAQNPSANGPGPIDAVQFHTVVACSGDVCNAGSNENAACNSDTMCPGGFCKPCSTTPSFCGVNSSGQE